MAERHTAVWKIGPWWEREDLRCNVVGDYYLHKPKREKLNSLWVIFCYRKTLSSSLTFLAGSMPYRDSLRYRFCFYLLTSVYFSHNRSGAVSTSERKNLKSQNLRLFNITVSVSDYGRPPLKAKRQARLSVLVFFPLRSPLILIETTDTTMTIRFDLKDMARSNIAKYGIIVQEYVDDNSECKYFIFLR